MNVSNDVLNQQAEYHHFLQNTKFKPQGTENKQNLVWNMHKN